MTRTALAPAVLAFLLTACAGAGTHEASTGTLVLSQGAKQELETKGQIVASATSDKSKDGEVSCRQEEILGSHRKRVVCMTRSEREQIAKEARETMRDLQGNGATSGR